jgi:RNA polymerase sigma-70 factor (ECF subfamily)
MDAQRSSDAQLMERFRAGDRDAFLVLYRMHYPAIFRFAFHLAGDRSKAAEVTQDVFVWLIHHADAFEPERGDLAAFLGGVARGILRRQQRSERRWLPLDDCPDVRAPADMARDIDAANLRRAIALLPEHYRDAVVLCDLENNSYERAAQLLGCAVGTIRSRLHRARQLLARKFQPRREPQKCCQ